MIHDLSIEKLISCLERTEIASLFLFHPGFTYRKLEFQVISKKLLYSLTQTKISASLSGWGFLFRITRS